jgi:predicted MPP superfamily phosphohydrolase
LEIRLMKVNARTYRPSIALYAIAAALVVFLGAARPASCGGGEPWSNSSEKVVVLLDHPLIETEIERRGAAHDDYRFAVFGDQRALADGEWQELVRHIDRISRSEKDLLFILDTGDIVENGFYSDQFHALAQILRPASHLPYLVGVGNHEKNDNKRPEALENTATFLGYLDPGFSASRMYYRKDIGAARFLFMDTNDFVYGDDGESEMEGIAPAGRAEEQMSWLVAELAACGSDGVRTTIVVMHHPIVQSSKKHRAQSAYLWNLEHEGERLPEILLDGGVDLILAGHTHTYERFVIRGADGAEMHLVNISGRPRGGLMWLGPISGLLGGGVSRRARDVAGMEAEKLTASGWEIPEGWSVLQAEAMLEKEADQFGLVTVEKDGGILLEMAFLDEDAPGGLRRTPAVRLK